MTRSVVFAAILISLVSRFHQSFSVERLKERAAQTERVAFSAGRTSHLTLHNGTTITYDRVFTNIGKGYDHADGVFRTPEGATGTYVFMFHGLSRFGGRMFLDLYQNGEYVVSAYGHTSNAFASASNVVVLEMASGDSVHIQSRGESVLFGKTDEVYVTFNGYLLYPDSLRRPHY